MTRQEPLPEVLARFALDGRVALVTGASSGLGAAVARTLAAAGARVAVVARRADRLEALADEIGGTALACDLLEPERVPDLVAEVAGRVGGPEILVNAAGMIAEVQPAEREGFDAVMQTLTLNLVTPLRLCQEVFPHMQAAGRGAIVNISSIGGQVGVPGIPQASYAASKAELSGLTVASTSSPVSPSPRRSPSSSGSRRARCPTTGWRLRPPRSRTASRASRPPPCRAPRS